MKSKEPNPPRWAERLLGSVCDPALREDLLGDLHERFIVRARSMSLFRAKIFYLWDVLIFLRPYVIRKDRDISLLFLLPVYLHAATRSLKKDALHSILTICGMSLSIIAFLFIAFFVDDELKYDRHYDKAERIYRISSEINSLTASTPVAGTDGHLGQRLKYIYPTIEETVAMAKVQGKSTVRYGDQVSTEDNLYKAERTYFKIFSHHWIAGNPTTALGTPKSIVLTRRLSDKYFKDQPPLNKIVTIGQQAFTVTGVIEDLPSHTDLRFDALLSSDYQYLVETDYWCITFILARSRIDESLFQKKLVEMSKLYLQNEVEGTGAEMIYRIERLPEVHFGKPKLFDTPKSSRSNIYVFIVIAFFILLIACINYTNLAVAKALRKTTEAGIRKMLGARSSQLVAQNISESFLLCGISTFLAVLAVWILFPNFNNLTGKEIQFPEVVNFRIVMIIFLLLALTCVVSALYPAIVWSSAKPVSEWNGPNKVVAKAGIRNTLIIIQFTISIGLMICTKVVYDQWKLLSQNDPGFNKEQVLVADLPNDNSLSIAQIKNALSSLSFVKYVSAVGYNSLPSSSMDIDGYEVDMQGENVSRIFNNITVDENYIDLLEIEVTRGKNFTSRDIENDENYVLVNESLVQAMEWQDPLGQILYSYSTAYEVIGVVKDFHFNSLHKRIEPIIIHGGSKYPEKLMVKVNRADFQSIQTFEDTWKK
jgi:putative ABC transport system permease protein